MAFGFGFGFGLQALAVGSRPTLALNFTGPTLDPQITFTRSTTATYTNSSGVLATAAINGARFDYNPVTLAPKGLLIEEQRVNLCLQSENFSTTWTNANSVEQTNVIVAPDGTQTADLLQADSSTTASARDLRQNVTGTVTAAHTLSVYAKAKNGTFISLAFRNQAAAANSCSAEFNLATGTISIAAANAGNATGATASITSVGNGWYRCSISGTADTSGTIFTLIFNGRTTSNSSTVAANTELCYLWGAQLEAGAFATSYIPTVASQVTRAADVAVMTGTNFSSWYNQSEGTFVASYILGADSLSIGVIGVDDNTSSNVIQMRYTSGSAAQFTISVGGVTQVSLAPSGYSTAGTYKRAIAYKVNSFNQAINGALPNAEDTSGTLPVVTQARIGNEASSNFINGHIQSITYYPSRLSNAELLALSA